MFRTSRVACCSRTLPANGRRAHLTPGLNEAGPRPSLPSSSVLARAITSFPTAIYFLNETGLRVYSLPDFTLTSAKLQ